MEHSPSFDEVKDAALASIESLCRRLLPQGRVKGNSYISRVPWRTDKQPSLSVLLKNATWKDWGADEGGSIIDLVMRLENCSAVQARDTLAEMLSLKASGPRPKPAEPKSCAGCAYLWKRFPTADYCTRCVDTLNEEPLPIQKARAYHGECGPKATLHQAAS